jgi:hypothetical protein
MKPTQNQMKQRILSRIKPTHLITAITVAVFLLSAVRMFADDGSGM